MKRSLIFAVALLSVAACDKGGGPDNPQGPVTPAEPIVLDTRGAEKVAADNAFAFAFDFFRQTVATAPADERANAFVSPLSLTMALGMVYNGASPEAAAEMAAALGVGDLSAEQVNAHYQTLGKALLAADPTTALAIANSIWARKGFAVKPAFYDVNRAYYNAETLTRDFALQATVDEINRWCADNTNGKIPEIIEQPISPDVMMYLINAVYFKGQWKYSFDKGDTRDEDFRLADGSAKSVKMMSQETDLPFYQDENFRAVDLPYGNGAFSMMVVMPSAPDGSLDEMIAGLDAETYNKAVEGLYETGLLLKLPRWKQECEFSLVKSVSNLGIQQIFRDDLVPGPLSGIHDVDPTLHVSAIKQKTFVEVNEVGTEAAAVTSVEIAITTSGLSGPPAFIVDRPFLYLIRERSTGAILFIGRMDNPVE